MRWPIHLQLLLPMLSVVVLAIVLASGATAYMGARHARESQEENLRRVVTTLTEARFPLREPVLRQMAGLSGAEFVLFDEDNQPQFPTLRLSEEDLEQLRHIEQGSEAAGLASNPVVMLGGRPYLCQRAAVTGGIPGRPADTLVVLYPEDLWTAAIRQAAYPALAAGAVAVIAVVLLATVLARRFVRPIHRLVGQTAAIALGEFHPVAVSQRDDEIRDLAVSINQMTERLAQYENEVRRAEQLRTLGQLGAGMAHQLRNAATGARMGIELHQRDCGAGPAEQSLGVALGQLKLMESYLQRFVSLGQPQVAREDTVPLAPLVEDVLTLVRPMCLHAGVELAFIGPPEPLCVRGDPEALRQLVMNLVLNAIEAARAHGESPAKVVVGLGRLDQSRVVLHVKDTGPGPAADVADRLFEPFVTGKPDGTGLGLFVARRIADDHHGSIRWERREGKTWFTVELPVG
jgi:signal transduction histidine kinase